MAAEDAYPYLPSEDLATGLTPDSGRLLVASPLLEDPHFARSVVLLLDVDPGGALGVVLNRPGPTEVAAVLERWHESVGEPPVVFEGGPVSPEIALGVATLAAADGSVPTPVGWHPVFDRCGLVDLDAPVEVVRPALAGLAHLRGVRRLVGGAAGRRDRPGRLDRAARGRRGRRVAGAAGAVVRGAAAPERTAGVAGVVPVGPQRQLSADDTVPVRLPR